MKSPFASAAFALSSLAALGALVVLGAATAHNATAATAAPAFKPDLARGEQVAATCLACHTADGTRGSPANPILAGQHPEYLVKQLQEFKAGKRKNAIMQGMAAGLSEEDMKNVAAFYASKPALPGFAKNTETIAKGEAIYRGGVTAKGIPACAGCHAPNGAGIPAQNPRLGGQHADYTNAQLQAFRSGLRANNAQMTGVASKMNDEEMAAVADYIAGLR